MSKKTKVILASVSVVFLVFCVFVASYGFNFSSGENRLIIKAVNTNHFVEKYSDAREVGETINLAFSNISKDCDEEGVMIYFWSEYTSASKRYYNYVSELAQKYNTGDIDKVVSEVNSKEKKNLDTYSKDIDKTKEDLLEYYGISDGQVNRCKVALSLIMYKGY